MRDICERLVVGQPAVVRQVGGDVAIEAEGGDGAAEDAHRHQREQQAEHPAEQRGPPAARLLGLPLAGWRRGGVGGALGRRRFEAGVEAGVGRGHYRGLIHRRRFGRDHRPVSAT